MSQGFFLSWRRGRQYFTAGSPERWGSWLPKKQPGRPRLFSMGGKEEEDNYKCTTTRTDWLTDCHRQLLKANFLVLTELAASEGRDGKAEGDVMRGAALLRDVRWFPPDCTREPSVHSLTASLHIQKCKLSQRRPSLHQFKSEITILWNWMSWMKWPVEPGL